MLLPRPNVIGKLLANSGIDLLRSRAELFAHLLRSLRRGVSGLAQDRIQVEVRSEGFVHAWFSELRCKFLRMRIFRLNLVAFTNAVILISCAVSISQLPGAYSRWSAHKV